MIKERRLLLFLCVLLSSDDSNAEHQRGRELLIDKTKNDREGSKNGWYTVQDGQLRKKEKKNGSVWAMHVTPVATPRAAMAIPLFAAFLGTLETVAVGVIARSVHRAARGDRDGMVQRLGRVGRHCARLVG